MTIADGRKINIRFTQPLVGNVLGLDPPLGYKKSKISMKGAIASALNVYSTSYPASNAIDGSASTYWRGTTAVNWLQVQFPEPRVVTKIRLYLGSYYIKTFTFSGSNDGAIWTQIGGEYTAASSTTAQWYEFEIENQDAYLYYRIDTLTAYSSRVYIYELQMYETVPTGNETKFTVSFDEYNYVPDGSLTRATRVVERIEVVDDYTVMLHFAPGNTMSIQRAAGDITVAYDGTGTLMGEGGPVLAFEHNFTPEGLVPKNNPHNPEHLELVDIPTITRLSRVYYTNTNNNEHVELYDITVTHSLLHIDDI